MRIGGGEERRCCIIIQAERMPWDGAEACDSRVLLGKLSLLAGR